MKKDLKNISLKAQTSSLRESIKKYGIENHIFEIVEECEINQLIEKERFYIKMFETNGIIFNENTVNHVQYKRNVPAEIVAELDKCLESLKKEQEKNKKTESEKLTKNTK